jgi:hypothetical protein
MNPGGHKLRRQRSNVLIASDSTAFIDIVGEMVDECGFEVTTPAPVEPPWLSMTRTQPVLLLCDCTSVRLNVERLMKEAVARGVPLLIVAAPDEPWAIRDWAEPRRITWLEFPIDRNRFRATLDALTLHRTIPDKVSALSRVDGERMGSGGANLEDTSANSVGMSPRAVG